jgi:hypothetical protein
MWHIWETGELLTGFWWGNLREGDHSEDRGLDWKIILNVSSEVGWGSMERFGRPQDRDFGGCL